MDWVHYPLLLVLKTVFFSLSLRGLFDGYEFESIGDNGGCCTSCQQLFRCLRI
jgi:hypothetical protein